MGVRLFTSPRFADHVTPPGHPERVERWEVMRAVLDEYQSTCGAPVEPRRASDEALLRVHSPAHLAAIDATAGRAAALDADTFTSPASSDAARLAAGAVIDAVDHVLDATAGVRAMAAVRPPGHHATRDRAMGFCLFNNVAVAAAHARARGLSRVAIVDFDVHHGNGTQASFYDDPSVLFMSSHQFPYYPGTGAADEIGLRDGTGFTVNLPLQVGATDADVELVYGEVVSPVLLQFRPELILVSAGFDAHSDDPLGGLRLTAAEFGRLMARLCRAADVCCDGRIVAVTEGGYDLRGLAESMRAALRALTGGPAEGPVVRPLEAARGRATLESVTPRLAEYWTL